MREKSNVCLCAGVHLFWDDESVVYSGTLIMEQGPLQEALCKN